MPVCGADLGVPQEVAGSPATGRLDSRFPRGQRLTESALFRETFDQGVSYPGRYMVLWVRRGQGAALRMGVVASKRTFRRAVDRARAKRVLREAFRLNRRRLRGDVDIVLVARRAVLKVRRQEAEKDLLILGRRAGIAAGQAQRRRKNSRHD